MHERDIIRITGRMADELDARRVELIQDAERKTLWLVCGLAVVGGIIGGTIMEAVMTAAVAGAM